MPDFGGSFVPDEVFLEILSYVPEQWLSSFSLVSKAWHTVVTPILYRRITLVWRRTRHFCTQNVGIQPAYACPCEDYTRCKPGIHKHQWRGLRSLQPCLEKFSIPLTENYPSLYLLLRTMVHSSSLASHVRHLRLIGAVPRSVWTDPQQTELSADDKCRIRTLLRDGPRTQFRKNTWIKELDNGSPSAFAALLLLCLGNLQALELSADFDQPFLFIGILPTIEQLFPHLTMAKIGTFRDTVFMGPKRTPLLRTASFDPTLLFYLPSIRQLSLNIPKPLDHARFEWPSKRRVPLAMNLEYLELSFTFLDEHDLSHLPMACPRLRVLKYDLWTTRRNYDNSSEGVVDLAVLQIALLPIKTTLEIFHLHIGKYEWRSGSWDEYFRHISGHMSFHDFPSLLHLHVPLQVLIGDHDPTIMLGQALPNTLAHLWINDDGFDFPAEDEPGNLPIYTDEEVVGIMLGFLAEWQKYTPSLRAMKLLVCQCSYLCWDQWDPEMLANALEPRGNETDLDVSVVMLPYRCLKSGQGWGPLEQRPPYFDQELIEEHRLLEKGQNNASYIAHFRQRGLL